MEKIKTYCTGPHIIRFIISGATGTLINVGMLFLCVQVLHIWYLAGSAIAFIVAFAASFALQKWWTFRDRTSSGIERQMAVYFLIALCNLGVNTVLMFLFVDRLGIQYILAQLLTSALIACESFFLYGTLVFIKAPVGRDIA